MRLVLLNVPRSTCLSCFQWFVRPRLVLSLCLRKDRHLTLWTDPTCLVPDKKKLILHKIWLFPDTDSSFSQTDLPAISTKFLLSYLIIMLLFCSVISPLLPCKITSYLGEVQIFLTTKYFPTIQLNISFFFLIVQSCLMDSFLWHFIFYYILASYIIFIPISNFKMKITPHSIDNHLYLLHKWFWINE